MQVFLKLPKVATRTARSRSSIYTGVREGTFPAPVKIGARAVAWLESEIDAWIAAQVERSRRDT